MSSTRTIIQNFYAKKTIFLTGGTGFLGSILIVKLLTSCSDVKRIYVLVRSKFGKDVGIRYLETLNDPIYDGLKKTNPDILKKLIFLAGDLEASKLGLNKEDLETILTEVNCIFHVGATVRFSETVRQAVKTNTFATNELITIAKQVKDLKSFVYVSTAYSHCWNNTIDEIFYETEEVENLLTLEIDDEKVNALEHIVLEKWPNAYAFSKACAEEMIRRRAESLPVAIVRPSIILSTYMEPLRGWTSANNTNSVFISAFNLGMAHVLGAKLENMADFVPADYVVNHIIAVAWNIATKWENNLSSVQIYNYISSEENVITWGQFAQLIAKYQAEFPLTRRVWHSCFITTTNKFLIKLFYWVQLPLMHILDLSNILLDKPRKAVHFYKKMHLLIDLVFYFTAANGWIFKNCNTQRLWNILEQNDKELFNFDIRSVNWDTMFFHNANGIRLYLLNDPIETLPQAQRRTRQLQIVHYFTVFFFVFLAFFLLVAFLQYCTKMFCV